MKLNKTSESEIKCLIEKYKRNQNKYEKYINGLVKLVVISATFFLRKMLSVWKKLLSL